MRFETPLFLWLAPCRRAHRGAAGVARHVAAHQARGGVVIAAGPAREGRTGRLGASPRARRCGCRRWRGGSRGRTDPAERGGAGTQCPHRGGREPLHARRRRRAESAASRGAGGPAAGAGPSPGPDRHHRVRRAGVPPFTAHPRSFGGADSTSKPSIPTSRVPAAPRSSRCFASRRRCSPGRGREATAPSSSSPMARGTTPSSSR
jgi:hypothetical protein